MEVVDELLKVSCIIERWWKIYFLPSFILFEE